MIKRNHSIWIGIVTLLIVGIYSCTKDFIEKKLDNEIVTLLAPANNVKLGTASVTFWWSEVEGATNYNLQLVKPNFSSIQSIVLDTNTSKTKYTLNVSPGNYQWRVRAQNNSSKSAYAVYSFSVDSTLNISSITPTLSTPVDDSASNSLIQTFKWDAVYQAEYYTLEIRNKATQSVVTVVPSITNTYYTYTFNTVGDYTWRISAANATASSKYSNSNTLYIDQTAPTVSTPVSPAYGKDTTGTFKLIWSSPSDVYMDSLDVSTDSVFVNTSFVKAAVVDTFYSFTGGISGKKYYWRLKSRDKAGNWSGWGTGLNSKIFRFRIK